MSLEVSASDEGRTFTTSGVACEYVPPLAVRGVDPDEGSVEGGASVTIRTGPSLASRRRVRDDRARARLGSDGHYSCASPAMDVGAVASRHGEPRRVHVHERRVPVRPRGEVLRVAVVGSAHGGTVATLVGRGAVKDVVLRGGDRGGDGGIGGRAGRERGCAFASDGDGVLPRRRSPRDTSAWRLRARTGEACSLDFHYAAPAEDSASRPTSVPSKDPPSSSSPVETFAARRGRERCAVSAPRRRPRRRRFHPRSSRARAPRVSRAS